MRSSHSLPSFAGRPNRRGEEFEDQTHNKKYSTEVPEDALLLNESFSVYRVLYLCTHAGNPRDRSSGKRPSRNVRPVRRGAQYQFTKRFTTTYSGKGSRGIPQKILKYIWENTDSEPCMVDVHNLLAKLKREEDAVNNEVVARCIVFQTAHMHALSSSFPEMLMVDAPRDQFRALQTLLVHSTRFLWTWPAYTGT
ncbi:hypothetical protein PC116_g16125 [Phytophthora cactorum]|nr:hypothetical protein PC112_g13467 [Phytophthora cactorum]KAG2826812.1 hypothetical protein PC111_g8829 [Phytophthora cactorum]KAG4235765.1 hypothetical protein PC116_g16125 [Phytophthora cactorum]